MKLASRPRGILAAAFLLLVAAAAVLPLIDLPALAPPLKTALTRAVGRPADFGNVRLTLLPVPSLVAENLVIGDDPAFGLEPLAYADELRASIRLAALVQGSLEVSALQLTGASLNVARDERAGFNVASFLQKALADPARRGAFPGFSLRQSRINFRSGPVKSAYYLNGVDLDLQPPRREGDEVRWRYEASPARTDRAEQGFGRFMGSGRWIPGDGGGRFAVDVSLERSAVAELLILLTGRDLGLQGRFVARAFLDGPPSAVEVRGQLEMEEVERPSFFGLRSRSFQVPFQGVANLDGQTLTLASAPAGQDRQGPPLQFRLEGRGLLTLPEWLAELAFENLPAPALLDLCRRLGIAALPGVAVDGAVSGSARFASGTAASGRLEAGSLQLRFGDAPPVKAADAALRLDGDLLTLESARVVTPGGAGAQVSGAWDSASGRLSFEVATEKMEIAELNGALAALPLLDPAPLLHACTSGFWSGRLGMSAELSGTGAQGAAAWTGRAVLSEAQCRAAPLPSPVRLGKAVLELRGAGWRLREGEASFAGSRMRLAARLDPSARPPLLFEIDAERLEGEDIEAALQLAQPPRRSLLDRALRRRAAMPAWLRQMQAGGTLQADLVVLGRQEFEDVAAGFVWRGAQLQLDSLRGKWKGAQVQGTARASLWREEPEYRIRAVVTNLQTGGGALDAELEAFTPTLGAALAQRARGWADASSPALVLPSAGNLRQVRISLEYDGGRGPNPWRLPEVSFWLEGAFWSGRGQASAEGAMRLEFPSPGAHWEGTLWPPSLPHAAR